MISILSVEQVRKTDEYAINTIGVPSIVLMENAANFAFRKIKKIARKHKISSKPKTIILCGSGNNGGDGWALARLMLNDFDVRVVSIAQIDKMSSESKINYSALKYLAGDKIIQVNEDKDLDGINWTADIIIDALIGVGGSDAIRGKTALILKLLSKIKASKIAIDVPTGLNADSGEAFEYCFEADYTITIFAVKKGMLIKSGFDKCGKILTANLGVPNIANSFAKTFAIEHEDLQDIIPTRNRISSKFDYGKVAIIAGSEKYPGAAALSANAAVKSGAGLVYLLSTNFHHYLLPEIIQEKLVPTKDKTAIALSNLSELVEKCSNMDSIVIGPGLSNHPETIELIRQLIEQLPSEIPIIIDADGINAISINSKLRKNIVLTPHSGEFARLINQEREVVQENYLELCGTWATKLNCILYLKNVPSVASDGETEYWNLGGNPGMASGGMGDILSGIIGAMLALKIEPLKAVAIAAYIHSFAGDLYAAKFNQTSLTAESIIDMLKYV